MELLLVRHGKAEERERWLQDDALRPLTDKGRKQLRAVARGLRRLVPDIDLFACSPLLRAMATAEVVAECYDREVQLQPLLAPGGDPAGVLRWLRGQDEPGVVALFGHEPDMGLLASWALAGSRRGFMPLKKGGACLLSFPGGVKAGGAELVWAAGPRELRALGT